MTIESKLQNKICRVYKKNSLSPWADSHTYLLLADIVSHDADEVSFGYENYIYLHKSTDGIIQGISVSKKLLSDNSDFDSRYLDGAEMYRFLLLYRREIKNFAESFSDCFMQCFMVSPKTFFKCAKNEWQKLAKKR